MRSRGTSCGGMGIGFQLLGVDVWMEVGMGIGCQLLGVDVWMEVVGDSCNGRAGAVVMLRCINIVHTDFNDINDTYYELCEDITAGLLLFLLYYVCTYVVCSSMAQYKFQNI